MNSYFPIDYPFDVSYREECVTVCKPVKYENKFKESVSSPSKPDLSNLSNNNESKSFVSSFNDNNKYYGYNDKSILTDNDPNLINDNTSNRPLLPKLDISDSNITENELSSENIKKILNSLNVDQILTPEDLLNSNQFKKLEELSKRENKENNAELTYIKLGISLFIRVLNYLSKNPNDKILKYLAKDFSTYTPPTEVNINNLKDINNEIDAKGYDNLFKKILESLDEKEIKPYDETKNLRDISDNYSNNYGSITKLKYNLVEGFNNNSSDDEFDNNLIRMMFIICLLLLVYYCYKCMKKR